jgi:hypothetical protein
LGEPDESKAPLSLFSFAPEKILHKLPAVLFAKPCSDFYLVVQQRVGDDIEKGFGGASFAVRAGVDKAFHPAHDQGARAHGARFQGHIESAAGKAPSPQPRAGLAERDYFGVRRGILPAFPHIVGGSYDGAVFH